MSVAKGEDTQQLWMLRASRAQDPVPRPGLTLTLGQIRSYMAPHLCFVLTRPLPFLFPSSAFVYSLWMWLSNATNLDFTTLPLSVTEFIILSVVSAFLSWKFWRRLWLTRFWLLIQSKASSSLGDDRGKVWEVGRMAVEILWYQRVPFLETAVGSQWDKPGALIESKLDERINRLEMKRDIFLLSS